MTDPNLACDDDALTRALRPLAQLLAPLVADELGRATNTDVYSVRSPMPGASSRWMRAHLSKMTGSYLGPDGRRYVSRADALAYVAALSTQRGARRSSKPATASNVVDVADWLSSAGMRATRTA